MITPLPGVSSQQVRDSLRDIETSVMNLRSSGGTAYERFDAYRRWAEETAKRLGALVSAEWVTRLVTTRRYWTLQGIDPAARSLGALAAVVDLELDERLRVIQQAREELDAQVKRWHGRTGVLVVPDTNVYLHHESYFDEIEWPAVVPARSEDVHLVVPMLVVDELDDRKRSARNVMVSATNPEHVRTRAHLTLKRLDRHLCNPSGMVTIQPSRFPEAGAVTVELLLNDPRHVRLPRPDDELIDRAAALQALTGRTVYLVTFDTGMAFRGRTAGLEVVQLKETEDASG